MWVFVCQFFTWVFLDCWKFRCKFFWFNNSVSEMANNHLDENLWKTSFISNWTYLRFCSKFAKLCETKTTYFPKKNSSLKLKWTFSLIWLPLLCSQSFKPVGHMVAQLECDTGGSLITATTSLRHLLFPWNAYSMILIKYCKVLLLF